MALECPAGVLWCLVTRYNADPAFSIRPYPRSSMITPQSCTELLARMVGFDTVVAYHSGRPDPERELSAELAELATSWGFAVTELPIAGACHNLLVEYRVSDSAPWLLFDAHLDTVGTDGMTIDPFAGEVREGRLYGRGACDTKGTGAAMLWALGEYAKGQRQPNNVAVLYSVAEEHVQLGARAFVDSHLEQLQWRPAGVVVGEPTQMNVLAATGGFERWKMSTRGKACHSSRPDRGHNAIYDIAQLITAIEQQYIAQIGATHPLVGKASAAITVVHGGKQVNVIPSAATLTFDRRLVPGEVGEAERAAVQQVAAQVAATRPGMQVEHHDFESAPPMAAIDGGEFAERAARAIRSAGIDSQIRGELFTTNGNHFAAAGLPTIVAGPGDIAQAHMPDEWIAVEQLERGVAGYRAIMQLEPA